jgi:hypothetical protein
MIKPQPSASTSQSAIGMSLESAWRPLRTFLKKRTPWLRTPDADSGILEMENVLTCERRKGKLHEVKTGVQELGELRVGNAGPRDMHILIFSTGQLQFLLKSNAVIRMNKSKYSLISS